MGEDDWAILQSNLEATIPVYDRINRFATFGQDQRWRRMVQDRLPDEGKILEIGCGPGSFAENLTGRELTCLDPIAAMLSVAEPRVNNNRLSRGDSPVIFVEGTAESLPFEDSSFDAVCSLFSFRDWYDKKAGLSEALRVLKPGGKLVIVDPAKMNRFHGWLGYLYMRIWVGSYARFVCKQRDHPWKWLTKTYVHFGTTKDYVKMMREIGFSNVQSKVVFPGMATIWQGEK
ncbi:MAG: class I SAM-dependent methyltransferase [Candidatus Thalassarchaeaceae archaeon]|nr:class I SAM-dependent methyltransferase [Candidatus Thalassarchaeaceae archaeon]|tara:strand:+ start:149 stop:841 length:693 start_codon:yes stop_codon:yes gene_type:complete